MGNHLGGQYLRWFYKKSSYSEDNKKELNFTKTIEIKIILSTYMSNQY